MIVPLVLAAALDGSAALQHATRLAALGPHPWGSGLSRGAAQYVESQLRAAGLPEVRLEEFEARGIRGVNVVGVRPGTGREIVLVGAHHDSAPGAPGAYDDGGGVGILLEVARVLARDKGRTLMFVSWDGEEGWARGAIRAGSRAFLDALGPRARDIVGAVVVEMCGWKGGTPAIHAIAYADPMRPGQYSIATAGLVRETLTGARRLEPSVVLGDRYLSWVYQPAVRLVRVGLYGDDQTFVERGIPAVMVSDSTFSAFYPWYHQAGDTADKLDAGALQRAGQAVLGAVQALEAAPLARLQPEPQWWSAFGHVLDRATLLVVGLLSLVPSLLAARSAGRARLGLRVVHAAAFAGLLWRAPVIAVWSFVVANLLAPFGTRRALRFAALAPFFALVALAAAAVARGAASGLWLAWWECALGAIVAVVALTSLRGPTAAAGRSSRSGAKRGAGRGRRRGLPKER